MLQIGISDISKNPSIIDKLDDIAEILNKKTKQVKGVFIPKDYLDAFDELFKEIEYKKFKERNRSLSSKNDEDGTLLDGLDEAY